MTDSHSDALVFFGATGDLAYKKIFPSLQPMVKRGHLNVPVIGVAKAGLGQPIIIVAQPFHAGTNPTEVAPPLGYTRGRLFALFKGWELRTRAP